MIARHYDAAGGTRRSDGWWRSGADANTAAAGSLQTLREFARDLYRNNGYARKACNVIVHNTIGHGIRPRPSGSIRRRLRTKSLWREWAETSDCDHDGQHSYYDLQSLAMLTAVLSGEALAVRRWQTTESGIPFRIQVLEPDYIDTAKTAITGASGPIIQGVEFDKRGRRVAYWLFDQHPGAVVQFPGRAGLIAKRIPVEDVLHLYRIERPGQVRGITWLAAALVVLNELDDYMDAALLRNKIAAAFTGFVTSPDDGNPISERDPDDRFERLEPGRLNYLSPGEGVTFSSPPPDSGHKVIIQVELHKVAATMEVPYEELASDFGEVNFSSSRMSRLSHYQSVYRWRSMFETQWNRRAWGWFSDGAVMVGLLDEPVTARWTAPPMPLIEPDKEGLSYQRLMRNGIMSYPQVLIERGIDPESQLDEIADYNDKFDGLGLVFDSDARKTNGQGALQISSGGGKKVFGKDAGSGDGEEPAKE